MLPCKEEGYNNFRHYSQFTQTFGPPWNNAGKIKNPKGLKYEVTPSDTVNFIYYWYMYSNNVWIIWDRILCLQFVLRIVSVAVWTQFDFLRDGRENTYYV